LEWFYKNRHRLGSEPLEAFTSPLFLDGAPDAIFTIVCGLAISKFLRVWEIKGIKIDGWLAIFGVG